jgi:predicted transcriptional regulator
LGQRARLPAPRNLPVRVILEVVMEVSLPQNQESELNELALKTGRGTDELVREAVERLLAHNQWFKEQVQVGIDQIARGEFIEEEEMDARVERMLQS